MNEVTIKLLQTYGRASAAAWNTGFEPLIEGTSDWEYFDAGLRIRILLFQALLNRDAYDPRMPEYPSDSPSYGFPGYGLGVYFRISDLKPRSVIHVCAEKLGITSLSHLRDRYLVSQLPPGVTLEFLDFYNPDSMGTWCNKLIVARVVEAASPLEVDQVIVADAAALLGAES